VATRTVVRNRGILRFRGVHCGNSARGGSKEAKKKFTS
jgi:hypothetical protein